MTIMDVGTPFPCLIRMSQKGPAFIHKIKLPSLFMCAGQPFKKGIRKNGDNHHALSVALLIDEGGRDSK